MPETIKVQVSFTREHNGITYSDALYFDQDEYATLSADQITVMEDDRFNAWVTLITNPPPTTPLPASTLFTKFGFRQLFSLAELVAIDNFDSNPSLSAEQKATLKTLLFSFQVADSIDLADPTTQMGVGYLEECGLIPTGRAAEVLSATTG